MHSLTGMILLYLATPFYTKGVLAWDIHIALIFGYVAYTPKHEQDCSECLFSSNLFSIGCSSWGFPQFKYVCFFLTEVAVACEQ